MNYLEHETQVRYVDGFLAHSQEWQWFIDEIQEQFEIKKINSWEEYVVESVNIRNIFDYFIKILKVCGKDWKYTKSEFEEIWEIAKFYVGNISINECIRKVSNTQCKIFLFCIWITKLENEENSFDYLYDIRLLKQRNYFELINCDSLLEHKDELIDYISNIPISGLDIPLKCFLDNLYKVEYHCDIQFLLELENEILSYDTFSYKFYGKLDENKCNTWQEAYLMEMLMVSFRDKSVLPIFSGTSGSFPDVSLWSREVLEKLKRYFNHELVNFILETIEYMAFNVEPSKEVKMLHCTLLIKAIESSEPTAKIFSSSSYIVLSYLHQEKLMGGYSKDIRYNRFLKIIQNQKDPTWIIKIKDDGYPISNDQKNILREFLTNKFKQIEKINRADELSSYLKDNSIIKEINREYIDRVIEKFKHCTEKEDFIVSKIYYEYMLFLININKNNKKIDKRYIQKEMIRTQKNWQDNVYEKQCKDMRTVSCTQKFDSTMIDHFNDLVLVNPIVLAQNCTPCSENGLLNIMIQTSENPLSHIISGIKVSPIYPVEKGKIVYERHDIDKCILEYVNELKSRKGYKLLNQLESEIFVSSIHEKYEMYTDYILAMFTKEENLYNEVKKETHIDLIPYSNTISLAMLTQLFPILEIKIRDLVTLFDIFPFKKNLDEFMQYNDPSSLLRELLMMIFKEQHSFENVPDLIFVYHMMYNGNSCNVRNECIHGRNYLFGGSLRFAFRATLFAIHMINFRINTIKNNISDLIEF